jgi:hypothetical protein
MISKYVGQGAEYTRNKMLESYDIEMREREKKEKEKLVNNVKEPAPLDGGEHRPIADQ